MNRMRTWTYLNALLAILLPLTSGCQTGVSRWWYFGKEDPAQEHYRQVVSEIDYSDVVQAPPEQIEATAPPRTIITRNKDEVWDLSLQEAIHTALGNNEIIRSSGQFLQPGSPLFTSPSNASSVYDPAIQASGVLFGGVGVEAALSSFDANWTTGLFFGRNETVQNNPFGGGVSGGTLETDSANFRSALSKQMAYGAQFTLSHDVNYNASNSPVVLFPSTYTGNVQAEYRQQLLAGAGPEFVRVAGPLSPQFASIAGVGNGVLIARINQDISITRFESDIRNLVKDVEDTYWDLYLAYRTFDTAVTARNAALRTWKNAKFTMAAGGKAGFTLQDEAQARDRYFETRAQAENSLGDLYTTEQRLRNLLAIEVNDRRIIRPADSPIAARLHNDWYHSLAQALTERVELRRQKWEIKSLELQLGAAKNFARPRLDVVARYRVNGFGDRLLGYDDTDRFGGDLNNMYETITQNDQTGWDLGLEFSVPIGLRASKTQVRNIELRLIKARKVLSAQELDISHELAVAFQELEKSYATAVSNYSRRQAAMDRYRIESALVEGGSGSIDLNLRAQESLATAAVAYHRSLTDYNKAIVNLYFRTGTLLKQDNIHLMEGQWDPQAYQQAYARAKSRANAIPAPHLKTVPPPFAADGQIPSYGFSAPEAAEGYQATPEQMELTPLPEELPLPFPDAEPTEELELKPAPESGIKPAPQPEPESGIQPAKPQPKSDAQSDSQTRATPLPQNFYGEPVDAQLPVPMLNPNRTAELKHPSQLAPVTESSQPATPWWETMDGPPQPPSGTVNIPTEPETPGRAVLKPQSNTSIVPQWTPTQPANSTPIQQTSGWAINPQPAVSEPAQKPKPKTAPSRMARQIGKSVPQYR